MAANNSDNTVMKQKTQDNGATILQPCFFPTSSAQLPLAVATVPQEIIQEFGHTKRVGHYLLGRTLGEGSFAKVKEGLNVITGEKVAIKIVDKKKAKEDPYVRKNMRREGRLLQLVRHPNIVQLFELMETENSYYLVMEYCGRGDLMMRICNKGCLTEREARRYIRQIISAIEYLHRGGIVHRDLKVENLLLDEKKNIKLIDFGLSNSIRLGADRDGSESDPLIKTDDSKVGKTDESDAQKKSSELDNLCSTQCGSPAYAAPELLANGRYGPKVDIWSIGVNMYAMLAGTLPFTVDPFTIAALHKKMLNKEMNPLPDHLSSDCKDLIVRFLTVDPTERITLKEAMQHPWITEGGSKPLYRVPYPNRLQTNELVQSVIKHMTSSLDFRPSDLHRLVTANAPCGATAVYHLLARRLRRYQEENGLPASGRRGLEVKGQGGQDNKVENVNGLRRASIFALNQQAQEEYHLIKSRSALEVKQTQIFAKNKLGSQRMTVTKTVSDNVKTEAMGQTAERISRRVPRRSISDELALKLNLEVLQVGESSICSTPANSRSPSSSSRAEPISPRAIRGPQTTRQGHLTPGHPSDPQQDSDQRDQGGNPPPLNSVLERSINNIDIKAESEELKNGDGAVKAGKNELSPSGDKSNNELNVEQNANLGAKVLNKRNVKSNSNNLLSSHLTAYDRSTEDFFEVLDAEGYSRNKSQSPINRCSSKSPVPFKSSSNNLTQGKDNQKLHPDSVTAVNSPGEDTTTVLPRLEPRSSPVPAAPEQSHPPSKHPPLKFLAKSPPSKNNRWNFSKSRAENFDQDSDKKSGPVRSRPPYKTSKSLDGMLMSPDSTAGVDFMKMCDDDRETGGKKSSKSPKRKTGVIKNLKNDRPTASPVRGVNVCKQRTSEEEVNIDEICGQESKELESPNNSKLKTKVLAKKSSILSFKFITRRGIKTNSTATQSSVKQQKQQQAMSPVTQAKQASSKTSSSGTSRMKVMKRFSSWNQFEKLPASLTPGQK